ncbi:MAG TPA: hypothetical protein VF068_04305 [Rubrobacter sp.]
MIEPARQRDRGDGGARVAVWLAWSLAALSVVLCAASVVLFFLSQSVQPPTTWGTGGNSAAFIFLVPFLPFPLVGALIASRRPENPIGWICLAAGLLWMLAIFTGAYGVYGLLVSPDSVPFPAAIGSLTEWLWVPSEGLLGTYLILLFPDGKLPSMRWRPLAWLSGAVIVLTSAGVALEPGSFADLGGVRNPFGLEEQPWIAQVLGSFLWLLPMCILASATSLFLRFRRSGRVERQQIKWIAFAAAFVALGFLALLVGENLFSPGGTDPSRPLWEKLFEDAVTLSYAGVPIAMGFAVLRYRLYDIDVVINRALVYGALSATLVVLYFGGVATTQAVFRTLTGQQQQPQLAIVISTLIIAALFNPLRRRIQSFIDRRFYRRKYDARKTLEAFSATLRDETDLQALNGELTRVVRETMQPAHVSLWLRPDVGPKDGPAN